MESDSQACVYCGRTEAEVPLIAIQYRRETHWICPQHLPILIHKPAQLAEKLPGMEDIPPPAEGHAHEAM